MHYPLDPAARDLPGFGDHTDYECFTLLLATSPGLEVVNGRGDWIDAPPVPGAFVVNIGDMLEHWSGGALVATRHRVRKVAAERYSFPLFFNLDYATRLTPLDRAAGAAGLSAGEHLYAQTIRTFHYLQDRLARGEITMPADAVPLASFGRQPEQGR
jgi:isopenicillin N synthase-like dioxygenase